MNQAYSRIAPLISIFIILLVAVSLSCQDGLELEEPNWEKESEWLTTDDVNILNTILDDSSKTDKQGLCEYIVLVNRTERYCSYAVRPWEQMCIPDNPRIKEHNIFKQAPELNTELKKALLRRNTRLGIIKDLSTSEAVRLVSPEEIETLRPNFWDAFYKRFPKSCSFISFSLPGYSKDKQSAAVYFNSACGGTCGTSSIIELTLLKQSWSVKKQHILSMS